MARPSAHAARARLPWPLLAAAALLGSASPAAPRATGEALLGASAQVIDQLDLSDRASRARHRVLTRQGAPISERATFGTLSLPVAGVALAPGGSLTAAFPAAAGPLSALITLATPPREFGRRTVVGVQLDGRELLRWAEIEPGGGPAHSLVVDFTGSGRPMALRVVAGQGSEAQVIVQSIRLYRGLNPAAKLANPSPKMALALLSRQESGYGLDAAELRTLAATIPPDRQIIPQAAVLYNFCTRSAAENATEIDHLAALAEETGVPLRIAFQVHWGGIPRGVPDGAGNTFTDLPYQQITFDSDDQVDETDRGLALMMGGQYDKRYGLSVPNRWSDTPWLTFNHPRLNRLRQIRLTQALRAWTAARDRLAASGKAALLPPQLSTGDETIYWALGVDDASYTKLNGGKPRAHLMADFNPFVIHDALKDGITIDPRNGLSPNARWWLHQNLAKQQQRLIDWMFSALPADPIRVPPSDHQRSTINPQPIFAFDEVRRNLYTEPYAMAHFPMKAVNPRRPGLESGYVREGRSGGEYWSGATMLPWLVRDRERGRIALPNLECTGARSDEELAGCLQAAYAMGARFATLYNWRFRKDFAAILGRFEAAISEPPGLVCPPVPDKPPLEGGALRTYAAPEGSFGVNCLELLPVPGSSGQATVRIELRDAESDAGATAAVTATVDLSSPVKLRLPSLFHQLPEHSYRLAVHTVSGVAPKWMRAADGFIAVRLTADLGLERTRSLAIEQWQDSADILESLRAHRAAMPAPAAQALTDAERAFTAGNADGAYRAAIRAEQLTLPASFDMPAGKAIIAPYDVAVTSKHPLRVVLRAWTAESCTVTVLSAREQTVEIKRGDAKTAAGLTAGGAVTLTLDAPAATPKSGRLGAR